MATVKSTNVTKFDAGGSGDNCIPDGYIKTVEKVWLDTYVVSAAIPTTTSIKIATIPANKKITDIVVHLPVLSAAATTSTVYACTGATTATTTFFGALKPFGTGAAAVATATVSTVALVADGAISALAAETSIYLMITPATTITAGTIKTIVRYT